MTDAEDLPEDEICDSDDEVPQPELGGFDHVVALWSFWIALRIQQNSPQRESQLFELPPIFQTSVQKRVQWVKGVAIRFL